MILGSVWLIDCVVFVALLIPQLLREVRFSDLLLCSFRIFYFFVFQLAYEVVQQTTRTGADRTLLNRPNKTVFENLVLRCVRYAFAEIPASVGVIFFDRSINLPFLRFRMLRHGYLRRSFLMQDVQDGDVRGLWLTTTAEQPPDVVVYYLHGGGFSMGSSYFYAEFLVAWMTMLRDKWGYRSPAIFALEYTLVPHAIFPKQLQETLDGYSYVLNKVRGQDASRICIAGDSAGGTLLLSLLLLISTRKDAGISRPGFATLISPWCKLISDSYKNSAMDYLNVESLQSYACQYLGIKASEIHEIAASEDLPCLVTNNNWLASPASCISKKLWKQAIPAAGCHFVYGTGEVFAPEIKNLAELVRDAGIPIHELEDANAVHAWPIVNLFLSNTKEERLRGLVNIVDTMATQMGTIHD